MTFGVRHRRLFRTRHRPALTTPFRSYIINGWNDYFREVIPNYDVQSFLRHATIGPIFRLF